MIDTCNGTESPNSYAEWMKQDKDEYIVHISIYINL